MLKNIVLVGQPNAGKTTLFNSLTGGSYRTGNYPGVTVDYAVGKLDEKFDIPHICVFDSPGLNSLYPSSIDEQITVNGLFDHSDYESPDLVVSVVDATQLSRQLYLTKQLIDSGFNVLIVLTMTDVLEKQGKVIDLKYLEKRLGVPIVKASGKNESSLCPLTFQMKEQALKESRKKPELKQNISSQEVVETYKSLSELESQAIHDPIIETKSSFNFDQIALHPYVGVLFFVLFMGTLFSSIFWFAAPAMDFIDESFGTIGEYVSGVMAPGLFQRLVVDGVIAGIGAVMVFLPQIVILFFLMELLIDCGYLARAAVIVDMPLSKIGLSGRSFVPLLSGFACAIPAIMSARTIKNPRERFISMFIIPLMSCSARLPVFVILLSLLIPSENAWVGGFGLLIIYSLSLFFASIVAAIIGRYAKIEANQQFALELPMYRVPHFKTVFNQVYTKSLGYIKDAGTVILMFSVIMWGLSTFSTEKNNEGTYITEQIETSVLGSMGQTIEPILEPLGLDWRCGVAVIASFTAREIFVGTLAQIFRLSDEEDEENKRLIALMRNAKHQKNKTPLFTASSISGLIIFYIFALLCFPTMAVAKREFGGWKVPVIQFSVFGISGYALGILVVQSLRAIGFA